MCLSRETENPSMTCLLSSFVAFHWKGKIPVGFAGLHPPGAEDKPWGSAQDAAAPAVESAGTGWAAEHGRTGCTGSTDPCHAGGHDAHSLMLLTRTPLQRGSCAG